MAVASMTASAQFSWHPEDWAAEPNSGTTEVSGDFLIDKAAEGNNAWGSLRNQEILYFDAHEPYIILKFSTKDLTVNTKDLKVQIYYILKDSEGNDILPYNGEKQNMKFFQDGDTWYAYFNYLKDGRSSNKNPEDGDFYRAYNVFADGKFKLYGGKDTHTESNGDKLTSWMSFVLNGTPTGSDPTYTIEYLSTAAAAAVEETGKASEALIKLIADGEIDGSWQEPTWTADWGSASKTTVYSVQPEQILATPNNAADATCWGSIRNAQTVTYYPATPYAVVALEVNGMTLRPGDLKCHMMNQVYLGNDNKGEKISSFFGEKKEKTMTKVDFKTDETTGSEYVVLYQDMNDYIITYINKERPENDKITEWNEPISFNNPQGNSKFTVDGVNYYGRSWMEFTIGANYKDGVAPGEAFFAYKNVTWASADDIMTDGKIDNNKLFTVAGYEAGSSSIDEIIDNEAGENAPAEYFNLQGIRVAHPEAGGFYICRQGSKVTKIVVR